MRKNVKNILLSLCSSIALGINYSYLYKHDDLTKFYNTNVFIMFLIFIGVIYLLNKKDYKLDKYSKILCILFSTFMIIGDSYININSYNLIVGNVLMFIASIIKFIGYYVIIKILIYYIWKQIKKYQEKENKVIIKNSKLKKISNLFNEHPFLFSFITILIVWSIYVIAFYPTIMSPDPTYQIEMFFNIPTKYINYGIQIDPHVFMTTHHPIIHTYLIGYCLKLGKFLLNDNFGLFIYSFIQMLLLSSTLAYTIYFAKKNDVSNKYRLILLLIYTLVPMFGIYSVTCVKDVLYTVFMIQYVMIIFNIVKNYRNTIISIPYLLYFFLVLILLSLFRNNGFYEIILSLPFLIIYTRKNVKKLMIVLIVFISAYFSFNNILIPYLGISKGSIREMLSIPFQQTARYVKYHDKDIGKKDKKVIDKILEYNTLAKRYHPTISDEVKNKYNPRATKKDLKNYFKTWYKMFFRHPGVYIDATLNNTYGYFYPNSHNWYVYSKLDDQITKEKVINYHYNNLNGLRDFIAVYANIFPYIPFIGLLSSIGTTTWILLLLLVLTLKCKNKKLIIPLIPLFITLLICIASPVNTYFRYAMPNVFIMPFLVGLYLKENKIK